MRRRRRPCPLAPARGFLCLAVSTRGCCAWARRCSRGSRAWEAPGGNRGIAWVLTWCLRANAASALPLSARSRSRLPVLGLVHTWLRGSGLVMFSRLLCSGLAMFSWLLCLGSPRWKAGDRATTYDPQALGEVAILEKHQRDQDRNGRVERGIECCPAEITPRDRYPTNHSCLNRKVLKHR